jgi:hypothetical protein
MKSLHSFGARLSSPWFRVLATGAILAFGVIDLPISWGMIRVMKHAMKSPEIGRESAGYYEGLLGVSDAEADALKRSLVGEPTDWVHFTDSGVSQMQTDDILLFRLSPNVSRSLFGKSFTTNSLRMRDRPIEIEKPANVVRIALLGASMDMGWGVATEETYENRLEDWLNEQARRQGDPRRFEIMNFAVAAYSPTQRLESYRRFARKLKPDMVFYATTMLDARLTEIHLCDLLTYRTDFSRSEHLTRVIDQSDYTASKLRRDPRGKWLDKNKFKGWLEPYREGINHQILGDLVKETQADGVDLYCLIIPRAGRNDLPHLRRTGVETQIASARTHGVPIWDLTDSFDEEDPDKLALATWDDHPNTRGHELIFRRLAETIVNEGPEKHFEFVRRNAASDSSPTASDSGERTQP